jgi:hypothetical protein
MAPGAPCPARPTGAAGVTGRITRWSGVIAAAHDGPSWRMEVAQIQTAAPAATCEPYLPAVPRLGCNSPGPPPAVRLPSAWNNRPAPLRDPQPVPPGTQQDMTSDSGSSGGRDERRTCTARRRRARMQCTFGARWRGGNGRRRQTERNARPEPMPAAPSAALRAPPPGSAQRPEGRDGAARNTCPQRVSPARELSRLSRPAHGSLLNVVVNSPTVALRRAAQPQRRRSPGRGLRAPKIGRRRGVRSILSRPPCLMTRGSRAVSSHTSHLRRDGPHRARRAFCTGNISSQRRARPFPRPPILAPHPRSLSDPAACGAVHTLDRRQAAAAQRP